MVDLVPGPFSFSLGAPLEFLISFNSLICFLLGFYFILYSLTRHPYDLKKSKPEKKKTRVKKKKKRKKKNNKEELDLIQSSKPVGISGDSRISISPFPRFFTRFLDLHSR